MAQVRNGALRLRVSVQEVQSRTHGDAVWITEGSAAPPCKELLQLCLHVPVFHAGQRRRCLAAVTAGITAVTAGAVFAVNGLSVRYRYAPPPHVGFKGVLGMEDRKSVV